MKDPALLKQGETSEQDDGPDVKPEDEELAEKTANVKIDADEGSGESEPRSTPNNDEQAEFNELVYAYTVHQRMMQLSFSSIDQFLDEKKSGKKKLRQMEPTDVKKLSEVELTGLLYWIEEQKPYTTIPDEDKSTLLHRYSVRKLSLDHFYSASKHPEHCEKREFVMNNYTFVPNDRTGFELPEDDEVQIKAKRECFSRTFNRFWKNVIKPFMEINVKAAEIVYMHIMLLWSDSNDSLVTPSTVEVMATRREWARTRLETWYYDNGVANPQERLETVRKLLAEIEMVCGMHCEDFLVAKMFEFCDMSEFFYETLCYAPCNADRDHVDPCLFEKFKKYATKDTSAAVMEDVLARTAKSIGDIDPTRLVLDSSNLAAVMQPLPDDHGFRLSDLGLDNSLSPTPRAEE